MILHKDPATFSELIELSAKDMNINPLYVEKDYWVTYILKNLSKSIYIDTAIFKGGTSLSKAHKVIHRFSEDIDLALVTAEMNGNQIKSLIKKIEKSILGGYFHAKELPEVTSKGSQFRKTVHSYPTLGSGDFGHATENIILEINSFAKPTPCSKKSINTYIAEYLSKQEPKAISEFELEPFEINVLDMERTFCEKISAVARASYESNYEQNELKNKIRHLYDIHLLLPYVKDFLDSSAFVELVKDVREDDKTQFGETEWTNVQLHTIPIFKHTKSIMGLLEYYYLHTFKDLVYSAQPSFDDVITSVDRVSKVIIENNL